MNEFSRLINSHKCVLEKAPCIAPWYFTESQPKLFREGVLLKWNLTEKIDAKYVGTLTLQGVDGPCLGLLKIYTYLLPGPENDSFLVWSRQHSMIGPRKIDISLYETSQLQPIENFQDSVLALRDNKDVTFRFNSKRSATISFATSYDGGHDFRFPKEFKAFEDFCVVDEIPGIYGSCDNNGHTTCIIRFCPRADRVIVYPQDWFNKSEPDIGYVWITRAAINRRTGRIHGQGIRINDFVLDKTNRNRKRW